jgi:triacylglycerol lipase
MMARWLRLALAGDALLAALVATAAMAAGVGAPAAATLAIAVAVLLPSVPLILAYALSRRHAFAPPPSLAASAGAVCGAVCAEWLAASAVFILMQPFERWWMGDDRVGRLAPGERPVLLVHGYLCNRGLWWSMRRALRAEGLAVATINLEPPLGDIDSFAAQLDERITRLLADTGADQLVLIAHSMGGLAARACLQRHGGARVAGLITLATPHRGTRLARLGPGRNARQMEPGSLWLQALSSAVPVPAMSIWSARDEIVVPQDNGRLGTGKDFALPAIGHLAMVFSPAVRRIILSELRDGMIRNGSRAAAG